MTFTEQSVVVRELCNGAMFISSVVLIGVFVAYIIEAIRLDRRHWYRDLGVQAAGAIIVLMIGHSLRAGSSWLAFAWLHAGWRQPWWANTATVFILATVVVVIGKMLMVFAFASYRWRWHIIIALAIASVTIPLFASSAIELLK